MIRDTHTAHKHRSASGYILFTFIKSSQVLAFQQVRRIVLGNSYAEHVNNCCVLSFFR